MAGKKGDNKAPAGGKRKPDNKDGGKKAKDTQQNSKKGGPVKGAQKLDISHLLVDCITAP